MGHSDVLLQGVDVSEHVRTVVAVKRRDVCELKQREGCCCRCRANAPSAGAVGLSHMLVEVVERRQSFQAELAGVALLWLVCMDGLQMDLQHGQAVEISLGAVWAGVRKFSPAPS